MCSLVLAHLGMLPAHGCSSGIMVLTDPGAAPAGLVWPVAPGQRVDPSGRVTRGVSKHMMRCRAKG